MRCAECRHWRQSLIEPVDKAQPSHHRWFLALAIPALLVLLIWVVFAWSLAIPDGFFWLGIYPRTVSGLVGIALGPLIHANLQHAVANSVPNSIGDLEEVKAAMRPLVTSFPSRPTRSLAITTSSATSSSRPMTLSSPGDVVIRPSQSG